ncbi:glycerate kinase [Paeniglutamicibacter sp. MACA_103]|uniref:glycerate kinase n=1 Tax=Paeniglutamicibacter sp. MACA_103 TaxID=3377337 RepID=UPI00389342FA
MRILLALDKFKGSLNASEAAGALAAGLGSGPGGSNVECRFLPLADGGDGSVQAALAAGFTPLTVQVSGPDGTPANAILAFNGTAAVIEVATTSGLQMLVPGTLAPLSSSSDGFGQGIAAALGHGPRQVVLALGGSATTDGGAGMLSALGMRFFDDSNRAFVPSGGTLKDISYIDDSGLVPLDGVDLIAANDVQNPLLGPDGAAAVYGPQKGANATEVQLLEAGLAHLVLRLEEAGLPAAECARAAGAGSAGGLGFAAMLLGARMVSGADFFLDLLKFETALAGCDMVITGEGKLDTQTLAGKLPVVVARRAWPVPVIAVVGHNALDVKSLPDYHIEAIHSLESMTRRDSSRDPELSADLLRQIGARISCGHQLTQGRLHT